MTDILMPKIISPDEKMPVPGQYFFVVIGGVDVRKLYPAASRAYCSPETFYDYVVILNEDGTTWNTKKDLFYFGWAEMFPDTKCYQFKTV